MLCTGAHLKQQGFFSGNTACTVSLYVQAIAAAEQAAQEAECAAEASEQQLSVQLQEQAAENSRLKEQLKKLNADLLDLRGQLDVQTTQQSMVAARETQHQQQLQEQAAKLKEKAAELEATSKELQVSKVKGWVRAQCHSPINEHSARAAGSSQALMSVGVCVHHQATGSSKGVSSAQRTCMSPEFHTDQQHKDSVLYTKDV